jgi:hypothetical protein
MNIVVRPQRIVPLMQRAVAFVLARKLAVLRASAAAVAASARATAGAEARASADASADDAQRADVRGVAAAVVAAVNDAPFSRVPAALLSDRPNYSVTADLCRQMLARAPAMTVSFNTARCLFSMSWLCEFWANTDFRYRFFHGKWSYHHCGGRASSVANLGLRDPREARPLAEFLFYTRDQLMAAYNNTDFGRAMHSLPTRSDFAFLPAQ